MSGPSDYDRDHINELIGDPCPSCGGMKGQGDWFTAQLLRLIAKSDRRNRERLRLAFPEEVQLFEEYVRGHDE